MFLSLNSGQMIGSIAGIYHPGYSPEAWQTYLMYLIIVILAASIICLLPRAIPKAEIVMLAATVLGFIASFVTLLAAQPQKQSGLAVFAKPFVNPSGFSDGTAFMIGQPICMYAYMGLDGATHVTEETANPAREIPRALGFTMLIGILTAVPYTIAVLFAITDSNAVAESSVPIYTVYLQATRSRPAATVLTVWIIWIYFGAVVSCLLTAGRLAYAFSRDGGLPFSHFFAYVSRNGAPANGTLGCAILISLYGLIYIGSTTAFNSFINMATLALNVSYAIPQAIVLLRGRENALPKYPYPFRLGKYVGPACNLFSFFWMLLMVVFACFPTQVPTTPSSMNYVSVVICGLVLLIYLTWLGGKRKTFTGPVSFLESNVVVMRRKLTFIQ